MDRFHAVHDINLKNLLMDTSGPESGLQQFKQPQGLIICGQRFGPACHKQLNERKKQQWAIEKPKLDNARKLIYFIDPDDKEFKETVKNAKTKLELPMEAAIPCEESQVQGDLWRIRQTKIKACMRRRSS